MPGVRIVVEGLAEIIRNLESMCDKNAWKEIREAVAEDAVKMAYENAPQDTQDMRDSIYYNITNEGFEIFALPEYTKYNEFGTTFMPVGQATRPLQVVDSRGRVATRPFLRPAVWLAMQNYPYYFGKKFWFIKGDTAKTLR